MNKMDEQNKSVWKNVIENAVMLYPAESVARFLGRNYSKIDRAVISEMKALDIGTGSGRNLKALLDYGFQSYGIDYIADACNIAKNNLQGYKNLKEIYCGKFINFRTTYDYLYQTGQKIDDNTFILENEYKDAVYSFFNLDEAKELLINTGFKIENIEREDYYKDNLHKHNSWWMLQVTK